MADALFVVLRKVALSLGEGALAKIGTDVVEAAPILTDFEHGMRQIEGELLILQAFIGQVRAQKAGDKAFHAWLDQVRDVAHEVEDIVDEYAYLTTQAVDTSFFKRKFHQVKNFAAWQKLPVRISQVEARIQRLSEMRNRYGISVGEQDRSSKLQQSNQLSVSDSAYLTDDSEIVGHAEEIGRLTQWLLEENQDRTLIAIFGMGGLGKTTVASSVYRNQKIRRTFDCHAWVTVSQTYQVEELLREIMNQLIYQRAGLASGLMTMGRMRLVEKIQSYLQDKKYFIVLDDVWEKDAWLFLNYAFVKNNCGSKVLITTRRKDVSSLAVHNHVIELRTLNYAESLELFCKKAFFALEDNICPKNLTSLAEKIVDKCQGLPLAIVTIGSILSYHALDEWEWAFFYKQLNWQLANNSELSWISSVLNLSLDDLPSHLRSCFLYCSLFPEDHWIKRKQIAKLWIAEGLVEERGDGTTMEEVAEHYLAELTHRSLLQVIERNASGRPRKFLMHDLVREVTSITAEKEKFAVIHGHVGTTQVPYDARRLCIQKSADSQNYLANSHLRSFILFDSLVPSSWIYDVSSRFRLLRVLGLRFTNIEQVPPVVTELYNLRYLDISYTKVKQIPASFRKLVHLQVLDLRFSYVEDLPLEITMLTNLRHLYVAVVHDLQERSLNCFSATKIPGNICGLKNLQSLHTVSANKDLVSQLGNLTLMRSLTVMNVRQSYIAELWNSLTKMPNLSVLIIFASDMDEILNLRMLRPLRNLKFFWLAGKMEGGMLPSIFNKFEKLTQLKMDWSGLNKDPISSFSYMLTLVDLWLCGAYCGEYLSFCAGWFPNLKFLKISDMEQLTRIEIEDGTMMGLHHLELVGLRNMRVAPKGIKYIRTLHQMFLTDMPKELVESLRGSDSHIVQHVPNIHIFDSTDSEAESTIQTWRTKHVEDKRMCIHLYVINGHQDFRSEEASDSKKTISLDTTQKSHIPNGEAVLESCRQTNNACTHCTEAICAVLDFVNQLIIGKKASMPSGFMTMSRMRLVEVMQSYLQDKKYFIVLDDVWDKDAWLFLNYAFVRNRCGSQVLITTRRKDVSSLAIDNYVIELKTLKHAESWELFCKKAFRASEDNICPENVRYWADKTVAKCQGLPLAIITIGSILSYCDLTEQEWAFFFNQLSWQLANNPELNWISSVLKLSLNDLPSYLRSCFLYCSLFPEDYKIRRKLISKLWIAEGLVEERGDGTTMEEVAECYLMELTQRSLLQVTERKHVEELEHF